MSLQDRAPRNDPLSFRSGSLSLHITTRNFIRLRNSTSLTPSNDMPAVVRHLLTTEDHIGCSMRPGNEEADAIPSDGYCAYHTLWALDHPHQSRPPLANRRYLSATLAAICANSSMTDNNNVHVANAKLTQQNKLAGAHWPRLPQVLQWSNQSAPTCVWEASKQLPLPWLELTGLPDLDKQSCPIGAAWNLTHLRRIDTVTRHLALEVDTTSPLTQSGRAGRPC